MRYNYETDSCGKVLVIDFEAGDSLWERVAQGYDEIMHGANMPYYLIKAKHEIIAQIKERLGEREGAKVLMELASDVLERDKKVFEDLARFYARSGPFEVMQYLDEQNDRDDEEWLVPQIEQIKQEMEVTPNRKNMDFDEWVKQWSAAHRNAPETSPCKPDTLRRFEERTKEMNLVSQLQQENAFIINFLKLGSFPGYSIDFRAASQN